MSKARIHVLRNENDYNTALVEYESYFDREPRPGSIDADRFELLGVLLERYEADQYPLPMVDPVDAILFAMERKGLGQSDLAELLGSRSRASEILGRKRDLTTDQMRKLSKEWKVPAAALLSVYA